MTILPIVRKLSSKEYLLVNIIIARRGMHYYPSLHQLFLDAMIAQSVSRKTSMLYIGSTEIAFSNSRRVHVTNHIPANFNISRSYRKDWRIFLWCPLWNFPSIQRRYLWDHERTKLNFKWKRWQISWETTSVSQTANLEHCQLSRGGHEPIQANNRQKFQGKTLIAARLGRRSKPAPILRVVVLQPVPRL